MNLKINIMKEQKANRLAEKISQNLVMDKAVKVISGNSVYLTAYNILRNDNE